MPRSGRLYLGDIVAAAEAIESYVEGSSFDEAAARLSPAFRVRHADIPCSDVVAFRNIAVHASFAVDWRIVWFAVTRNAPALAERVGDLLEKAADSADVVVDQD